MIRDKNKTLENIGKLKTKKKTKKKQKKNSGGKK